jgi:catechol 2,3-dioxygenase-like lactoylglutathione lyase family enzyme
VTTSDADRLVAEHGPDGLRSLDHAAFTVRDMDRAVAFYRDLLGCTPLGQMLLEDGTFKLVYLRKGRAYIELFAHRVRPGEAPQEAGDESSARRPGYQHLAFQTDDVDAVAARLRAAGVRFTVDPRDAAGGVRLAFFLDPDGNELELVSNLPAMDPYREGWG